MEQGQGVCVGKRQVHQVLKETRWNNRAIELEPPFRGAAHTLEDDALFSPLCFCQFLPRWLEVRWFQHVSKTR